MFMRWLSLWTVPWLLSASVPGPESQALEETPKCHVLVTAKRKG